MFKDIGLHVQYSRSIQASIVIKDWIDLYMIIYLKKESPYFDDTNICIQAPRIERKMGMGLMVKSYNMLRISFAK